MNIHIQDMDVYFRFLVKGMEFLGTMKHFFFILFLNFILCLIVKLKCFCSESCPPVDGRNEENNTSPAWGLPKGAKELVLKIEGGMWWPKDERADKTKEGFEMQEWKN